MEEVSVRSMLALLIIYMFREVYIINECLYILNIYSYECNKICERVRLQLFLFSNRLSRSDTSDGTLPFVSESVSFNPSFFDKSNRDITSSLLIIDSSISTERLELSSNAERKSIIKLYARETLLGISMERRFSSLSSLKQLKTSPLKLALNS